MNPEHYQKVGEIFAAALELPTSQQGAYLNQACGDDDELRAAVETMLANYAEANAEGFLKEAAWTPKESAASNLIGQELRGYRIREELKGGGMGEIYLAERTDGAFRRTAIIKIVGTKLEADGRKRFQTERQILADLKHPNIAQIYDGGELEGDGRPFMIMEYAGQSLRQLLTETTADGRPVPKALPLAQVVEITRQACAGLSAAHAAKIIHRDIKPENILVETTPDGLHIRLIDFGIAIPQDSTSIPTRRATQGIIGTPAYMSPEQADGATRNELTPASDIYSMGVVIFEMLTGERPFAGHGQSVAHKHIASPPPAVSRVRPDLKLPKAVDQVLLRTLSKRPHERPATAAALAHELAAAMQAKSRGKWIAAGAGVLALALSVPFVAPFVQKQISSIPQASPTPTATVAPSPTPSITASPSPSPVASDSLVVSILRLVNGKAMRVSPDFPFRAGDQVRIANTPPADGVLYILQRGTSGKVSILFPDPRINSGNYQVKGGQEVVIPGQGDFKFDRQPGTETLYVLFARQRGEALWQELEAALDRKKTQLDGTAATTLIDRLETHAATMNAATNSAANRKTFTGQGALVGVLQLRHE